VVFELLQKNPLTVLIWLLGGHLLVYWEKWQQCCQCFKIIYLVLDTTLEPSIHPPILLKSYLESPSMKVIPKLGGPSSRS